MLQKVAKADDQVTIKMGLCCMKQKKDLLFLSRVSN